MLGIVAAGTPTVILLPAWVQVPTVSVFPVASVIGAENVVPGVVSAPVNVCEAVPAVTAPVSSESPVGAWSTEIVKFVKLM